MSQIDELQTRITVALERLQRGVESRAEAAAQAESARAEAEARADAERIRGEGDAQRNAIYAEAYNRDAEFFAFYRSMQAYENALGEGTPIVIPPDSEFFEYFRDEAGQ